MRNEKRYKWMMRCIVEAVHTVVEREGIEAVTVRKVAAEAGCNVATIYNYFDGLGHLLFFASFRELRDYVEALPGCLEGVEDPVRLYMRMCKCFNFHAFCKPEVYVRLFYGDFREQYNDSIRLYSGIFPEEIPEEALSYFPQIYRQDIHQRDYAYLEEIVERGLLEERYLDEIATVNGMILRGMLQRALAMTEPVDPAREAETTTCYQAHTLIGYGVPRECVGEFLEA